MRMVTKELEEHAHNLENKAPPELIIKEINSNSLFVKIDFDYEWTIFRI